MYVVHLKRVQCECNVLYWCHPAILLHPHNSLWLCLCVSTPSCVPSPHIYSIRYPFTPPYAQFSSSLWCNFYLNAKFSARIFHAIRSTGTIRHSAFNLKCTSKSLGVKTWTEIFRSFFSLHFRVSYAIWIVQLCSCPFTKIVSVRRMSLHSQTNK